jgi:uncharacterized protein (DUF2062 family)
MTPHKLAVTVSLGTVVGVLPFFGITTVLGTALAARFRLNIAATVLVSYLVQPLQLIFFLPFIKAGIFMFGLEELRLSLEEMVAMFRADWLNALAKLWVANLAGVSVWAIVALPVGTVLYFALLPLLRKVLPKPTEPANALVTENIPAAPLAISAPTAEV